MYSSHRSWYGYVLGPNPDYAIYDRILATYELLKQARSIELRLLTFEGLPAVLYLSAADVRHCNELVALANWRACSLPTPKRYFRLTVL
jgi:hypothetical protein